MALVGGLAIVVALAAGLTRLLMDALPNAANARYSLVASDRTASSDGIAALGVFAHPDDDPLTVGAERIRMFDRYLAEHDGRREPPAVSDYPADRRLERPRAGCWTLDRPCLRAVLPPETTLAGELARHATLLERFDRWLAADDARLPIDPSRIGWAAPGVHHLGALRLRLTQVVDGAGASDAVTVHRLEHLLERLRLRLGQADSLLEKMLVAHAVSLTLDTLALLLTEEVATEPLPALTADERSMTASFAGEFQLARDRFRGVLTHQDRTSWFRDVYFHALRAVLDVESSLNVVADRLAVQEAMAALPRGQFDEARARHATSGIPPPIDLANLVGWWILTATDEPDYTPYVAYLHGLDEKIALLNRLREHGDRAVASCAESLDCVVTVIDDTGRDRVCPRSLAAPSRPSFSCLPVDSSPDARTQLSEGSPE